jgi:hypothetical protein
MRYRAIWIFMPVLVCSLGISKIPAQSSQQTQPAQKQQNPAPKSPAEANPFPEDTKKVPVMPSGNSPLPGAAPESSPSPTMPPEDLDPVRSPDDPVNGTISSSSDSSSSLTDMNKILEPPPDEDIRKSKKNKGQPAVPEHHETAQEDESVGALYLDQRDWKGALSRFESAVVLDPENPDVYWGLAEAQRHLGQFAEAKANYQKVVDYDPDSKHAREAKKMLKDPELAKATAAKQ